MLKYLKDKQAQVMVGEYVMVIFLVLAAMTAITVYFKRAVQARIHDARYYMANEVRQRVGEQFNGTLSGSYEPYYTDTSSTISRGSSQTTSVFPGLSSGIFEESFNEATNVTTFSTTAPPRDGD